MKYSEKMMNALRRSSICIGLDTDIAKLPEIIKEKNDAVLAFNRAIADATFKKAGAYKLNFAFYESLGEEGWIILKESVRHIRSLSPDILLIADAKRGDIGNTADHYAKAILHDLEFDSITINPYMGYDSVEPFIRDPDKGAFILCLTSNPGSHDFQYSTDGKMTLYERIAIKSVDWNQHQNCGLVVGATHPDEMRRIRDLAADLPFLIPGIGAQGGDLASAVRINFNGDYVNAMINVSRSVIYASGGNDFAEAAEKAANEMYAQIEKIKKENKANNR